MNVDGSHTEDEQMLEEAERMMKDVTRNLEDLRGHVALKSYERDVMDDLSSDMNEMLDRIQARRTLAKTDWDAVGENLAEIASALDRTKQELPEEEEVATNDAAVLVINMIESMDEDLFEALSGVKDLEEEQ